MIRNQEKFRQVGGLLLEALMLFFVFTCSFSGVHHSYHAEKEFTFSAVPTDQVVFRDSTSSSETLLTCLSKVEVENIRAGIQNLERLYIDMSTVPASFVSRSIYNPFYTHLTASAP